jgi:hypothetical protein
MNCRTPRGLNPTSLDPFPPSRSAPPVSIFIVVVLPQPLEPGVRRSLRQVLRTSHVEHSPQASENLSR